MNIELEKENFKNHIATFTDYGNIKILDFKNPKSYDYRIRFLFEEDYCRLHISGDLGEQIASNYNNMTFEKFSDFVNNVGYFEQKIDCHNRSIYTYDEDLAREALLEMAKNHDWLLFSDASIVYTGNDIANAIDIATSPGDMDAMEALEKLETYADEHSEFLFARAKTLEEGFLMLEHKAKLWNKLSQEQTDNLLLNFVQHNPTLL